MAYRYRRSNSHGGDETKIIEVKIDKDLFEHVSREAKKFGEDISTYIRWCIYTGLYLEDLNSFVRSKNGEDE